VKTVRKALQLLGILDDVDIEWMAKNGHVETVSPGTVLIREKTAIDHLYFLLDGEMRVIVGPAGTQVATLLAGEVIGEISFVDSHVPSASVVVTRNAQVLAIPRKVLSDKLAQDTGFACRFYYAIARFLADRLYATVTRLGYGNASQDVDADEIPDANLDEIDLATVRFDKLLKQLRGDYRGAAVAV
jgi:CRP-like cAMP-binding protein